MPWGWYCVGSAVADAGDWKMNCQSLAVVSAQIMRELFRRKKLLGGRLSQPAMDESQLETQLRDTGPDLIISPKRPLSGPVSLNDVLLYGWVKHDDAMIYIDIPHIPYWGDEHQCAQTIFV